MLDTDKVYEASVSVCFASESQIAQPPVIVAETVTGENMIKVHEPCVPYAVLW
jgi:hypothetical protein